MRRGKTVIGKDVLSLASGQRLDTVKDVILGFENDEVVGLLVEEGGLLSGSKIVPGDAIRSFGRDAVVVEDDASIVEASDAPELRDVLSRPTKLIGTEVFTDTGDKQGSVTDIYFDEQSRRVLGLELSSGAVSDMTDGRRFLSVDEVVRIGPDVLYIRPQTVASLEQQQGGLKGAVGDRTDKLKTAAQGAAESAKSAAQGATESAKSAAQGATTQAQGAGSGFGDALNQAAERALVGKRTQRDVEDNTGSVLVPAGQQITSEDVATVRERGRLRDLATAVGMPDAEMQGAGISDKVSTATESASSLWDKFTAKIGEVTDSTGKRMDEESRKRRLTQIEDAVGRPVMKVILDLDDKVILDLGDIITHAAIQRADEAGALDSLLGSVYKADVSFDKQEMRLQRPGEAALENTEGQGVGVPVMEQLRTEVETAQRERDEDKARKKAEADAGREQRELERQASAEARRGREQERATAKAR